MNSDGEHDPQSEVDERPETGKSGAPRHTRRLSDKILIAFHAACDQGEFEVAERLLRVLEMVLKRPPPEGSRRRNADSLVAAYERLWNLRHPTADEF